MSLIAKLPQMTDGDLATLLENAARLVGTGSATQRVAAGEIIPAVKDELAARVRTRLAARPAPTRPAAGAKGRKA